MATFTTSTMDNGIQVFKINADNPMKVDYEKSQEWKNWYKNHNHVCLCTRKATCLHMIKNHITGNIVGICCECNLEHFGGKMA